MAQPALAPTASAGYTKVPNSFIENQHLLKLPASRAMALIIFRRESNPMEHRTLSDRHWEKWTGLKPRQKEYAMEELSQFGLSIQGRGDTAKFTWNWDKWNDSWRNPNHEHKSPIPQKPKAKTVQPGAKVHEDCFKDGCSKLRECKANTNSESPLLVMPNSQCTAQKQKAADSLDPEVKWIKTLAAMRSQFASAGVELLLKLLAVLMAITGLDKVSDYVLAEAIQRAYIESRGCWNSPVPLLAAVPNVLKGWKAQGQPMDDTGEDGEWDDALLKQTPILKPDEKPKKKRAVDLI